ncbi:hypothetical protein NC651_036290 [Populus alba x Populus x berolinensis]|nr:hypothetical protein NC651_036290 [Populus alba x Populus x berolinensis]
MKRGESILVSYITNDNDWAWPRAQIDSVPLFNDSLRNSLLEDPFNFFSELRYFDMYAGWCDSSSAMDQMLAFDGMPSFPSTSYVQKQMNSYFGYPSDPIDADDLGEKHSNGVDPQNCFQNTSDCIISLPTRPSSLAERMLRALSLFKILSGHYPCSRIHL